MTRATQVFPLPEHLMSRGAHPKHVLAELIDGIERRIAVHPRSLQREIGPSGAGSPCARRIGYEVAGVLAVNRRLAWKPVVGTAVHHWLARAIEADDGRGDYERYYVEQPLLIGEYDGRVLVGTADLYDRVIPTVIDWKVVGLASLRRMKAEEDPGQQYRVQLHLYGLGLERLGLPVDNVMLVAVPQNGELSDAWHWHQPYDRSVAEAALSRLDAISALVRQGRSALRLLETAPVWCERCPYYSPACTEIETACPGHGASMKGVA